MKTTFGSAREARNYIARIRHAGKRDYAQRYLNHVASGAHEGTEPEYAPLSYMAAQGVRLQLRELLGHIVP